MRTIHPLFLAKKIPFTYSKPQVFVLCHKSLKDISPRIGYHNKERLRLVYMSTQYDRELLEPDIDIGEFPNQAFSSGNTGPQRRVARMGHDRKTDAIVFRSVSKTKVKVFPKRKYIFLKRKCFYLKKICEMKVFWKGK